MKRYADAAVTAVIGFCIFEGITDGCVSLYPLLLVVLGGLAVRYKTSRFMFAF